MTEILNDLSVEALTEAIETNLYAMIPFSHGWPQTEFYSGPDISWCLTDVAFPPCNSVFKARLQPDEIDDTIKAVISRGRKRSVPVQWWTGKDTQPDNLVEKLVAHGFNHQGDGAGMAVDLLAMNENAPQPDDFKIIEVKDEDTLKTWCHVTCIGFGIPEQAEPALFEWFSTDIRLNQPLKCYLGIWQGKPVATSSVFFAEGVAGIYFVATVPEARCHGIGFAVTRRPLLEAREMGYRAGILQASKMGVPVYRRMGFKEYSKIGSFVWLNEGQGG